MARLIIDYKTNEEYSESYKCFTIRRTGDGLTIYDNNGGYVERMQTLIIHAAQARIDKILEGRTNL